MYPDNSLDYAANFLHMMFGNPCETTKVSPTIARAMDRIFLLHADHEQNASTSTVRLAAPRKPTPCLYCSGDRCTLGPPTGAPMKP